MKIVLSRVIGQQIGKATEVHKTIELPFAPVIGMRYHDGTSKDVSGAEIRNVIINYDQEADNLELYVVLESDPKGQIDIYTSWGWKTIVT